MAKQHSCLPITRDDVFDVSDHAPESAGCQFYNVTFLADFGPFRAGEKVNSLYVDVIEGKVQEYTLDGELGRSCRIEILGLNV